MYSAIHAAWKASLFSGVMGGVQSMEDFQKKFFHATTYKVGLHPLSNLRHACLWLPWIIRCTDAAVETNDCRFLQYNFIDEQHSGSPYCKYNDSIYQLLISSTYLGAAVCAIGSEIIARRYGRKVSLHAKIISLERTLVMRFKSCAYIGEQAP